MLGFFKAYCAIIARYVAKWGIAQVCRCETKYQEGISRHIGGVLTSLEKYRSDSIAVSRDMGPLSPLGLVPFTMRRKRKKNNVSHLPISQEGFQIPRCAYLELPALGPVQFSSPCEVAETWLTEPEFRAHFVGLSWGNAAEHRVHYISYTPDPELQQNPPALAFFDFLAFLSFFLISLLFLSAFPSFSNDFRDSVKRITVPCFPKKSKGWRVRVQQNLIPRDQP